MKSSEFDAYSKATDGMNDKATYKLANWLAHGYEITDTREVVILERKDQTLMLGKDGSIWIATKAS